MEPNYNQFLTTLRNIDDPNFMSWDGNLFLPPCNCCSPISTTTKEKSSYCTEASSSDVFNYKSTNDLNRDNLINLKDYTIQGSKSRTQQAYWLCNKYSLSDNIKSTYDFQSPNSQYYDGEEIMNSDEFKKKVELLKSDLHVLSPFNGCKLTITRNKTPRTHIKYLVQCAHYAVFRGHTRDNRSSSTSSTKQRKRDTTKSSTPTGRCPFSFSLFFDLKTLRWYIKANNCVTHKYHNKTSIQNFSYNQRHLTQNMKNELTKLNTGSTSTSTQANILMANNDLVVSRHVLYNNKVSQDDETLHGMTDAARLIKALEDQEDVTYFALYGESINSQLLTIPVVKQARQIEANRKHAKAISPPTTLKSNDKSLSQILASERANNHSNIPRGELVGTQSRTSHSNDASNNTRFAAIPRLTVNTKPSTDAIYINGVITNKSRRRRAQPSRTTFKTQLDHHQVELLQNIIVKEKDGMLDKDGDVKVLLACGWARNDDIAVLRRFPEVLHMDSTFRTNRERRPLFNIVVKDANNYLRTVFRCLLPSEKQCVFDTILSSVMPNILGEEICKRVQYIVTDGDSQEINAVKNACRTIFPNAVHNTCLWHMIILGLNQKSKIGNNRLKNVLRSWLWYTATNTETHEERKELLALLRVR